LVLCAAPARADDGAFNQVTVVDVVEGRLLLDQVVRVAGARIVDVRPADGAGISKPTRVVDATGKFLMPGLWDMHTHFFSGVPGCPEITFSLAVAHGVTGARDVAAHLDLLLAWRSEVEFGRMIGPRVFGTGPLSTACRPSTRRSRSSQRPQMTRRVENTR
jgi:hypothetical protein